MRISREKLGEKREEDEKEPSADEEDEERNIKEKKDEQLAAWISDNLKKLDQNSLCQLLVTCWKIWEGRNQKLWNNVSPHAQGVVEGAKAFLDAWNLVIKFLLVGTEAKNIRREEGPEVPLEYVYCDEEEAAAADVEGTVDMADTGEELRQQRSSIGWKIGDGAVEISRLGLVDFGPEREREKWDNSNLTPEVYDCAFYSDTVALVFRDGPDWALGSWAYE
nr:uncharacterized protein LOC109155154 [Ipomoea trifida]